MRWYLINILWINTIGIKLMKNRILFIGSIPHTKTAGGVLFYKIAKAYGIKYVDFLDIEGEISIESLPADCNESQIIQRSTQLSSNGIIYSILKYIPFFESLYSYFRLLILKKHIINTLKDNNYNILFAYLRGNSILILEDIIRVLELPLICFDTDTISAEKYRFKLLYYKKKAHYYRLLHKINKMVTIGESMQILYRDEFNMPSTILRLPFERNQFTHNNISDRTINIIFLGNIYAKDEFIQFLKVIDSYAYKLNNKKITINIASHKPIRMHLLNIRINNLGWLSEQELAPYLSKSHIAYLPYKFDVKYKDQMKYSFPSKAGLYITYNIPILFHGPSYSSFNIFLKKYRVGVSCSSLEENDIYNATSELINNELLYSECQSQCKNAYDKEFSNNVFEDKINDIFTINSCQK
jgi:hypothetical protein